MTAISVLTGSEGAAQTPRKITIKEFRNLPVSDTTEYVISGVVDNLRDKEKCRLYLKDETGSVLVFGIKGEDGWPLTQSQIGLTLTDSLTVCGHKTVYDNVVVEMKDARLISHTRNTLSDKAVLTSEKLDRQPRFKGKDANAFSAWVEGQLKFPAEAISEGTVYLRFTINKKGEVEDIRVLSSPDQQLTKEALRVVRKSPKWQPGMLNKRPVSVYYTFPVVFRR